MRRKKQTVTQGNITYNIPPNDGCASGNELVSAKPHYEALRIWTLRKYGLTPETYEAKSAAQQDVCAICGKPETVTREGRVKRLSVDHSRVTGRNRDLLCCRCNQAIGLLFEDPAIMRCAAAYIESHLEVLERVPFRQLEIRGDVA